MVSDIDYETFLRESYLSLKIPLIEEYIYTYGSHSAMPMKEYLKDWYEAKSQHLLPIFDNQLIISEDICYEEPIGKLRDDIEDKITGKYSYDFDIVGPVSLMEKKLQLGDAPLARELLSTRSIAANAIQNDITIFPGDNLLKKKFHISKGERPFKALKTFIAQNRDTLMTKFPDIFGDRFFEDLAQSIERYRVIQSNCLAKKKLTGRLCLSIHPLDYLTMSDNTYGWDSCMSWATHEGEYRVGVLEMMNSPLVVVAYLDGDSPWYPVRGNKRWSNKKWRELFIVHKNIISGIRGYNYDAPELEAIVLNKLAAMAENHGFSNYDHAILNSANTNKRLPDGGYFRFLTNLMYNDTEGNSFNYMLAKDLDYEYNYFKDVYTINYSGVARCLDCGEDLNIEDGLSTSDVVCGECAGYETCDGCGNYIKPYGAYYINDGTYCEDCITTCDVCCEAFVPSPSTQEKDQCIDFIFRKQNEWVTKTLTCCPNCVFDARNDTKVVGSLNIRGMEHYETRVALPSIGTEFKGAVRFYCGDGFDFDDLVDIRTEAAS